jgi:hypothetical protein
MATSIPGKLEISIYGPFIYLLNRNPIEIYSPRCAGHYAGIFSIDDEAPLDKDRVQGKQNIFSVSQSGIIGNGQAIQFANAAVILTPPPGSQLSPDVSCAYFCIKLPRPSTVVGISAHNVIIRGTNAPSGQKWATGIRLIYDYDLSQPNFTLVNGTQEILATVLRDHSNSEHFDFTIRHVGPLVIDPFNDDAIDCFESSRNMLFCNGAPLDWCLDYTGLAANVNANPGGNMNLLHRTGGDCGSPNLVVI